MQVLPRWLERTLRILECPNGLHAFARTFVGKDLLARRGAPRGPFDQSLRIPSLPRCRRASPMAAFGRFRPRHGLPVSPFRVAPGAGKGMVVYRRPSSFFLNNRFFSSASKWEASYASLSSRPWLTAWALFSPKIRSPRSPSLFPLRLLLPLGA